MIEQNQTIHIPKLTGEISIYGNQRWRGEGGRFVSKETAAEQFQTVLSSWEVQEPIVSTPPVVVESVVDELEVAGPRRFNRLRNWVENGKPRRKLAILALGLAALLGADVVRDQEPTKSQQPSVAAPAPVESTIAPVIFGDSPTYQVPAPQLGAVEADPMTTNYQLFCLIPLDASGAMPENEAAPIVTIQEGMYPWDVLVEAGMEEKDIMPNLDEAAMLYQQDGGQVVWHGSGTTRWLEVIENGTSYSDTTNVMRILGSYLQSLSTMSA